MDPEMDPVFLKETEADAPVHGMDGEPLGSWDPGRGEVVYTYAWDEERRAYVAESGTYVPWPPGRLAEMEAERAGEEWRASVDEALCGLYESAAGGE